MYYMVLSLCSLRRVLVLLIVYREESVVLYSVYDQDYRENVKPGDKISSPPQLLYHRTALLGVGLV